MHARTLRTTLILTLGFGCLALAGCNTVSGIGQDLQDASSTTKEWFSSSSSDSKNKAQQSQSASAPTTQTAAR